MISLRLDLIILKMEGKCQQLSSAPSAQACREVSTAFAHQPSALPEAGRASEKALGPAELVGALLVVARGWPQIRTHKGPEVLPPEAPRSLQVF